MAATLSGASGGAAGIITTPLMVMLGLSPAQAIATAKFGGFGISLGSSSRFFREKITDKRTVIIFSLVGAVTAVAGSLTLVYLQDENVLLQKIMGAAILLLGIPLLYVRGAGLDPAKRGVKSKSLGTVLLGFSIFFQVALGSGLGALQMIILIMCFGMTALVASATRRMMQLTVATVSLVIFIIAGLVDYRFGLVSLVTSYAGGFLGAHIAIKKGNKFVINLLAVASALLAIQLLLSK